MANRHILLAKKAPLHTDKFIYVIIYFDVCWCMCVALYVTLRSDDFAGRFCSNLDSSTGFGMKQNLILFLPSMNRRQAHAQTVLAFPPL